MSRVNTVVNVKINQEKDNEGEIYQEQGNNKPKETKIWPWIVGGIAIILVIGAVIYLLMRRKND